MWIKHSLIEIPIFLLLIQCAHSWGGLTIHIVQNSLAMLLLSDTLGVLAFMDLWIELFYSMVLKLTLN